MHASGNSLLLRHSDLMSNPVQQIRAAAVQAVAACQVKGGVIMRLLNVHTTARADTARIAWPRAYRASTDVM